MSVFSGFQNCDGVSADFFGDEYGLALPLPPIFRTKSTKPMEVQTSAASSEVVTKKNNIGNNSSSSNALAMQPQTASAVCFFPALDGLFWFETLGFL